MLLPRSDKVRFTQNKTHIDDDTYVQTKMMNCITTNEKRMIATTRRYQRTMIHESYLQLPTMQKRQAATMPKIHLWDGHIWSAKAITMKPTKTMTTITLILCVLRLSGKPMSSSGRIQK